MINKLTTHNCEDGINTIETSDDFIKYKEAVEGNTYQIVSVEYRGFSINRQRNKNLGLEGVITEFTIDKPINFCLSKTNKNIKLGNILSLRFRDEFLMVDIGDFEYTFLKINN